MLKIKEESKNEKVIYISTNERADRWRNFKNKRRNLHKSRKNNWRTSWSNSIIFFEDFKPIGNIPVAYLGKSIGLLATADVAYFGEGWKDARGCKIEHEVAVQYGIYIIED